MRIIYLNTAQGELSTALGKFIDKEKNVTDIFCFQESCGETNTLITNKLNELQSVTSEKHIDGEQKFSQVTIVNNCLKVVKSGTVLGDKTELGLGVFTRIIDGANKSLIVGNIHGLPQPGHKMDTVERIEQSKGIIDFFGAFDGPKIIGGDFNLNPETESVKMFEQNGYRNLVKEFGIKTTRNEYAWRNYPNNKHLFADYVFVSPEVKVNSFEVPEMTISDHLPLILEIED